jgi:hypothetical protein
VPPDNSAPAANAAPAARDFFIIVTPFFESQANALRLEEDTLKLMHRAAI